MEKKAVQLPTQARVEALTSPVQKLLSGEAYFMTKLLLMVSLYVRSSFICVFCVSVSVFVCDVSRGCMCASKCVCLFGACVRASVRVCV